MLVLWLLLSTPFLSTCQNRTPPKNQTIDFAESACLLLYHARAVRKGKFHCREDGDNLGELVIGKELRHP